MQINTFCLFASPSEKNMNKELIKKIADRMVNGKDTDWAMDIEHFDWVPAVGLYGIWKAWKSTGEERYLQFLNDWMTRHLSEAYAQKTVNSTAPLLTAILLYTETKQPELLKTCKDIAEYVMHEAPRTREGGLEHTVTEAVPGFTEQIWADTLFMVCIFLTKLGRVTGQREYIDFAMEQLKIHHQALRDEKSGLYFHGWNCGAGDHMSAVHWGRANAWIIYSTMEILETAETIDGHETWITEHATALKACQRSGGAFGTIIDDSDSYDEISATAGIAAGLAKGRTAGILDDSYDTVIASALRAVAESVNDRGEVEGVSTGTPVMESAAAYRAIPICPTLYGQGLAIVALAEE